MSSHINDSKNRKHKPELPSKQNLHANNRNTKLLVIMALSTNVISFAFAKRGMFMISKQNLHQSIKKLLNLANQILKVLFIRDLFNQFHLESKEIFNKQV